MQGKNTPAARIIRKLGGVDATARLAGRSRASVYRWTQPIARGGTGGLIPLAVQRRLIRKRLARPAEFAPREGEDLT